MRAPQLDAWPRPPIEGIIPQLQPVAHVLAAARVELPAILARLAPDDLWAEPRGVPSLGFQLAHLAGNIDRLFTYARGHPLSDEQRRRLTEEGAVARLRPTLPELLGRLDIVIEEAMSYLRAVAPERLLETRDIGREDRFATILDLLSSAAEHTSRHMGEIVTTAAFLRGGGRN